MGEILLMHQAKAGKVMATHWLRDLYHAEQKANSVNRNLVRELILKIHGFVCRGVAKRG